MLERDLYEQYRLNGHQQFYYRDYQAFFEKGDMYVIIPTYHLEQEEVLEMKQMSDYLQFHKEKNIAQFVPTVSEELMGSINGERVVIYKTPPLRTRKELKEGVSLARFHKKGVYYPHPPKVATRRGLWKILWADRLDHLENWWGQKIKEQPTNRFEKKFFESFPYFLGLTENAIQYIADCVWEDQRKETQIGTICHMKYLPKSAADPIIFPTQFIYDHPSRDLAEWIRYQYMASTNFQEILSFLHDYEKVMPLSPSSWRMLYGRLLFPLSYFEIIEGYYSSTTDDRKEHYENEFLNYLETTELYEQFLADFFKNIGLPNRNMQIPEIEWLNRVKI